ncbi:MAG: HlyD family efflux transporter periplasmic adaptor subunit [Patescibacteria group bacterium]
MDNEKKENIVAKIFRNKKIRFIIAGFLALILIFRLFSSKNGDFDTAEVKKGRVSEELILSGEVKAEEHAQLRFQTSGELDWVGVSEGEWVKKGQLLVKLDTANLYAVYEQAVSNLRAAEATVAEVLDEVKGHDEDETLAQADTRTTAEAARDSAYRALTIAQKIEMVNPDTLYFEVSADQSEVVDLTDNQKARIILDSFPEEEIEGEISYIGYTPEAGEISTTYKVTVKPDSKVDSGKVRVGMTGDVRFVLSQKEDVLYVPPQFISTDKKGKYVLKNSPKNKVYVEVGLEGEERTEIIGDIKEGDVLYD